LLEGVFCETDFVELLFFGDSFLLEGSLLVSGEFLFVFLLDEEGAMRPVATRITNARVGNNMSE